MTTIPNTIDNPRCEIRNLGVLNYAQGFTLWIYKSGDRALSEVLADGYFTDMVEMLAPGDHIHVAGMRGGALLHVASVAPVVRTVLMCRTPPDLRDAAMDRAMERGSWS
jgi:hypothetical protein